MLLFHSQVTNFSVVVYTHVVHVCSESLGGQPLNNEISPYTTIHITFDLCCMHMCMYM